MCYTVIDLGPSSAEATDQATRKQTDRPPQAPRLLSARAPWSPDACGNVRTRSAAAVCMDAYVAVCMAALRQRCTHARALCAQLPTQLAHALQQLWTTRPAHRGAVKRGRWMPQQRGVF
eukprot:jgi/Ulvmu1/3604/UM017_0016.1